MKKLNHLSVAIFYLLFAIWIITLGHKDAVSMGSNHIANNTNEISGIAKVSDGDTIKIDEKRIRLIEIDAPETSQMCFDADYNEYSCGKISKEFMINLAENKEVKCYYDKLDRYQRYLAKCYVGDKNINAEMVKNGMAVTYFFGPKNEEMVKMEEEAKEKNLGIWQGAFQLPKDYRRANKHK